MVPHTNITVNLDSSIDLGELYLYIATNLAAFHITTDLDSSVDLDKNIVSATLHIATILDASTDLDFIWVHSKCYLRST